VARIDLVDLAHTYVATATSEADYAVKPMTRTWRHGGAYALLGPSGCGKTTLLNIISGLIAPSRGRVLFDGNDVTGLPTERRNIAQVFQFPVIYDTLSVYDNLAFPLRNRGVERKAVDARVREIAELLDLSAALDRRAQGLTADVKQKVSLGRGLVRSDVAAILFDEPLTVIDPHLKLQLRSMLKQLHRQLDLTMIYVTHDQTEALTFADEVVVMYEGEVVQAGTPEDLFERPAHTFVGWFIGSPGMNVLPCAIDGAVALVGGHRIALGGRYPALPAAERTELGVRPEYTVLGAPGDGLPVRVRRIDDLGRVRFAKVELAGHPVAAIVPDSLAIDGDAAAIVLDSSRIHVYANGHVVAPVSG
jgi:glycerol transport system ATP-binding protein